MQYIVKPGERQYSLKKEMNKQFMLSSRLSKRVPGAKRLYEGHDLYTRFKIDPFLKM